MPTVSVDEVKASIKYHCGCKYTTTKRAEAKIHVAQTGHTMSVAGTVHP